MRSLTGAELLQLLAQAGAKLATREALEAELKKGLPSQSGRFDFVAVGAWLAQSVKN